MDQRVAGKGSGTDGSILSGVAQQWLYRYQRAEERRVAAQDWIRNTDNIRSAPTSQVDQKHVELIKAELEINKLVELATKSTQRPHPPVEPVTFLDWNDRAGTEYLNAFEAAGRPAGFAERTPTIGYRVYSNVDHSTSWDKSTVLGWINQKIDDLQYWWGNEAAIDAKHYGHVTCEQGVEALVSGLARGPIRIKIPGRDGSGKHLEDKFYDKAGETIADSEKKCDVLIGKDPTKAPFPDPAKELLKLNSLDELTPEFARQVLAQLGEEATDSRIAEVLTLIRTAASGSDDLVHVSTFTVRGADGEVLGTGSTRAYQNDIAISTVTEVKGLDGGAPVIEVSGRLADGVEYRQMLQAGADGAYSTAGNTEVIAGEGADASIDIAGLHDELGRRLGEFGVRTDATRFVLVRPESQAGSETGVATSDESGEPIRVAQADQADGSRPDVRPIEASEGTGQSEDTAQDNSTTPAEIPPQATAFQAGWTLYQSIRGGDGLGIATAGVNAVNIADWYANKQGHGALLSDDAADFFGTTGSGLGLASAGVGLFNAIDSGDPLGIAYSTASLAQQATQLWAGFADSAANTAVMLNSGIVDASVGALTAEAAALSTAASVLGEVVPILGAALALSQGNVIGAIGSILMMIPATFVIGLVITIFSSLFAGDAEPEYDWIPAAGNGSYTRGEDGAVLIEASGTNTHKSIESTPVGPGTEGANVAAGKLAAALSSLLLEVKASQTDEDGPAALALIPERLPSLSFLGHNAFVIEFADPLTGDARQVGANIVDVERLLVEVAHHTEALAPAWEAEQVEVKLAAGDPNAPETEAQYAHRLNPDASTEPAERADRQTLPALVVDLAGDGITTMKLPEETGRTLADLLNGPVRFDVDADRFLEAVEWPALGEALLALDRDGDGRIASARELLASPNLPEPMRGSEMLAWLDANRDGLLDLRDPGFAALALWLDVNADAKSDPGEVLSLAEARASALVLGPSGDSDATIRLEDGASLTVREVALEAEVDGVRMAVLPGGVLVEAENGLDGLGTDARLLYVSGVADLSSPETARIWGVDPALATSRGLGTADADGLDPSSDGGHRASREARRIVLGGAEQGLLFAGAAGAIAALGLGAPGMAAAEELAGRIEFVLPDGTLAPLAAPIVITEAVSRPREAAAEPLPPAHPPIVAQASDIVSLPLASATGDPEPLPVRSAAAPPIVVTADAIMPVSAPASALAELAPLAEPPGGGVDPFAQSVPTIVSQLTGVEDDAIVIDGAELLERAGLDGDPASVVSWAGEASHGQVFLGADGLVRFIPEANFHGTASFTYLLGGLLGRAEIALVGVNDTPLPTGDLVAGSEDRELLFAAGALAANDLDPDIATDGDSLRVTAVSAPEHGSVELLADGRVRFTPEPDFWGSARFAYTVEDDNGATATGTAFVQLASVNDAPLARGELIGAGREDTALLVDPALLLANDTDIDTPTDGDLLTLSAVFSPEHGQVMLLADGTVQFTPEADFHGLAAFGYTVSDGRGGLAHAQALVTVDGVNDAPVGFDELLAGAEDAPLVIAPALLLANEVDPDIVTDGQLLKVTAVGEASHGAVGLAPSGEVVFVPETDYWGEAAFSYTVSDGAGGFATARASVTLAPVEDPPIAGADGLLGVEDATLLLDPQLLIANDHDPDGDAVHFVGVAGAMHGAVSLEADGQVRFTPAPDFFGLASFGYLVADTKGNTTQGTAFVQLENVNDAPKVEAIEFGRALYAYAENSGQDAEGYWYSSIAPVYDHAKALELYAAGEARNSSGAPIVATYYQNGTLKPIGFDMSDAASYDEWGGSSYDDPLLAQGRVVAYDPDGDTLSFSVAAHPVHGSAAVGVGWTLPDESNAWRYQSTYGDGYHGADPFVVRVTDPSGESSTMTVHTSHYGTIARGGGGDGGCCPVMIDLDADGVELVDVDDSRLLRDLDGDGWMERLGWAAEDDALLAYDADDDGFITRADEISFVAYKPGARTDLEGLAAFDTDGDGKLTAADAEWGRFHLWQDRGADGRSDPGELTPLAETDIVAISLASDGQREARGANVLFGRSSYERSDGSTGEVGDVMFATRETGIPAGPAPPPVPNAAAEALEAHFARLALQFVQDMAAFDPKAPAELDVPPSAPPPEATLAENPLQRHEQAGTG